MVKFIVSLFIIMTMNILFSAKPNTVLYLCFLSPANFRVSLELLIPSFSHLVSFFVTLWLSIPSTICHKPVSFVSSRRYPSWSIFGPKPWAIYLPLHSGMFVFWSGWHSRFPGTCFCNHPVIPLLSLFPCYFISGFILLFEHRTFFHSIESKCYEIIQVWKCFHFLFY